MSVTLINFGSHLLFFRHTEPHLLMESSSIRVLSSWHRNLKLRLYVCEISDESIFSLIQWVFFISWNTFISSDPFFSLELFTFNFLGTTQSSFNPFSIRVYPLFDYILLHLLFNRTSREDIKAAAQHTWRAAARCFLLPNTPTGSRCRIDYWHFHRNQGIFLFLVSSLRFSDQLDFSILINCCCPDDIRFIAPPALSAHLLPSQPYLLPSDQVPLALSSYRYSWHKRKTKND